MNNILLSNGEKINFKTDTRASRNIYFAITYYKIEKKFTDANLSVILTDITFNQTHVSPVTVLDINDRNGTDDWIKIKELKWVKIDTSKIYQINTYLSGPLGPPGTSLGSLGPLGPLGTHETKTNDINFFAVYRNENVPLPSTFLIDPVQPNASYCMTSSNTAGENVVLGSACPINPDTKKGFNKCLNWRRTDYIGKVCRRILNDKMKEASIDEFCNDGNPAEDCACVNRGVIDKSYNEKKATHPYDDYCWYNKCTSGAYLLKNKNREIKCANTYCTIQYNAKNIHGDATFDNNVSMLNCGPSGGTIKQPNPKTKKQYSSFDYIFDLVYDNKVALTAFLVIITFVLTRR